MSFVSVFFLAALPLVAIPVAIHLYRGRQRDVIPWGAMQFLTQAATKGRSMERLEEMLLLAMRVGAIIALVLALAQPMVHSTWWGGGTDAEVVLIIDDSLSMSRTVNGFSTWDQLKENVREVVDEMGSGDRVQMILASGGGRWLTAEGIAGDSLGKSRLEGLLADVEPSLGTSTLLDALQRVIHSDAEGEPKYRRLVVFTDNQANSWQLEEEESWRQLETARQSAVMPTAIEIVECGDQESELENLAVMRLEASRSNVQPDEPVEFSATIENVGQIASPGATVRWLIDDQELATSDLESLSPKQSTQVKVSQRIAEPGNYAVTCQIDWQDQIDLDQQTSVVVEVSDSLPVLLVHDQLPAGKRKTAKELLLAALGYDSGEAQDWHSVYRPEVVTSTELANKTLSNYRGIIITSLGEYDTEIKERLSGFVNNGGGLWIALGNQVERVDFNRWWYDDGQGLCPVALDLLKTIDSTNEPAAMIHPPEHDHPATAQLANTTQLDVDEARLYEHWQLALNAEEAETVSVLLTSGDGSPLVVENYHGQGRVLVQAFPLGLEWSNLPQLKSYVVMVHDWLDYLTAGTTSRYNLAPGSVIVASPPTGATFATAVLQSPDGKENELLAQESSDGATILRYSQTQQPGLYQVAFKSGEEIVASLPYFVERDVSESPWQTITEENQQQLAELAELHFDATSDVETQLSREVPPEEPLWGALLLALVLLLASELLLSNWVGRQRSGVVVSTS